MLLRIHNDTFLSVSFTTDIIPRGPYGICDDRGMQLLRIRQNRETRRDDDTCCEGMEYTPAYGLLLSEHERDARGTIVGLGYDNQRGKDSDGESGKRVISNTRVTMVYGRVTNSS